MTARPFVTFCLTSLTLSLLAACGGGDKKEVIFDTVVGPNTKAQIASLPGDLRGDADNQRHTRQTPPQDMDPADPS